MTIRRAAKPSTTPQPLELQIAKTDGAIANAEAQRADLDAELSELASDFIANQGNLDRYVSAHARLAAIDELLADLRFHVATLREQTQAAKDRQRAWEAGAPAREAAARAAAIDARPDNALRIAQEAVRKEAHRHYPTMPVYNAAELLTDDLVAVLANHLRIGGKGEPRFVALNPEAFTEWCADNASELRTGEVLRTLTIRAAQAADSVQSLTKASATRLSIR